MNCGNSVVATVTFGVSVTPCNVTSGSGNTVLILIRKNLDLFHHRTGVVGRDTKKLNTAQAGLRDQAQPVAGLSDGPVSFLAHPASRKRRSGNG